MEAVGWSSKEKCVLEFAQCNSIRWPPNPEDSTMGKSGLCPHPQVSRYILGEF